MEMVRGITSCVGWRAALGKEVDGGGDMSQLEEDVDGGGGGLRLGKTVTRVEG